MEERQTQLPQKEPSERTCGFESHPPYQIPCLAPHTRSPCANFADREDTYGYGRQRIVGDVDFGPDAETTFASSWASTAGERSCSTPPPTPVDTDWHAKLLDVDPDGRAINVATGMVRARWRHGFERASFVRPGEIVEYIIALRPTANVFRAGHRIRLDITSSDFPNFDRNHNTGGDDLRSSRISSGRSVAAGRPS